LKIKGCNIPGESDEWDFGVGAGYYVDATTDLWKTNYNMYSYVTQELPKLVTSELPLDSTRQSIFGHSMGGHGALLCYLNNSENYKSCSAFAPICNPSKEGAAWGPKALKRFLGEDQETWKKYDSSLLLKSFKGKKVEILVDQGDADSHLEKLMPQSLIDAAKENDYPLNFRFQKGYDHGYYFISTFVGDHIEFHAKMLNQ
jgi:S-formylglutathione hydrolase